MSPHSSSRSVDSRAAEKWNGSVPKKIKSRIQGHSRRGARKGMFRDHFRDAFCRRFKTSLGARALTYMKMKVQVKHEDSFSNRGNGQLRNGLLV